MSTLFIAIIFMSGLGIILGLIIGIIAKIFKVETDSKVELVIELLPGANCGGCGKAGCADFAKSVVSGENTPSKCPVSSTEQITSIAQALGIEAGNGSKMKALAACAGDDLQMTRHINYNGILDCSAASLVAGGPKGCSYGCIGMGTCAHVCPFGAIEIINHLAVVHPELCVGCGKCVNSCPRGVLRLVPEEATCHVYCNSPAKGAEKRNECKVGCIGCKKCERESDNQFIVDGFLAKVNYSNEILPTKETIEKINCPRNSILTIEEHLKLERNEQEVSCNE